MNKSLKLQLKTKNNQIRFQKELIVRIKINKLAKTIW